eukprot:TRINITY_DN8950_c0_g1_i4.p1 TRINITY_DN8950_c0_g1~~TRINITY_DN8950_c0_g1_i4.p1  ORF type:complete len:474 (+),score=51.89 TRINITY_DN8950_c0_g1_i4:80-1501(+)
MNKEDHPVELESAARGLLPNMDSHKRFVTDDNGYEPVNEIAQRRNKVGRKSQLITLVTEIEEVIGNIEDGRISYAYFSKWKMIEVAALVFTALTLGVSVLEYEIEFNNVNDSLQYKMLWIISICTLILVAITVMRYRALLEYQKSRNLIDHREGLYSTGLYKTMMKEILLTIPHPNPFLMGITFKMKTAYKDIEAEHTVNEVLNILQLGRVVIIFRVLLIFSHFFSSSSHRVCSMYGVEPSYFFVIKSMMRSKPFQLVACAFGISIVIFGYAMRICERAVSHTDPTYGLANFQNTLWNVIVTMTTVGYGDYSPVTNFGRLVAFLICMWGVFIVSLMVVTLENFLQMNSAELRTYSVIERIQMKRELRNLAQRIIRQVIRMLIKTIKRKTLSISDAAELKRRIKDFKVLKREYRASLDESTSLGEQMRRQFEYLKDEIKDLIAQQRELKRVGTNLIEYVKAQELKDIQSKSSDS